MMVLATIFGAAYGACVGSFAATAALRLKAHVDPVRGRSTCDGCARSLGCFETVPFVGFVATRGACAHCGAKIDRFHLVGEAVGATLGFVCFLVPDIKQGAVLASVSGVLLVQGLIDLKTLRLPNAGNAILALLCGVLAFTLGGLVEGLISCAAALALLIGMKTLLEHTRSQTLLGWGDIKLVAALALGLGQLTALAVALASVGALLAAWMLKTPTNQKSPFGPALAAAGFLVLFVHVWMAGGTNGL